MYFRKRTDLPKVFGEGSWVIVAGSTDSIGYEFCLQLAAQGFNLVMLGRNAQKLKEKSAEVKKQTPKVQIQTIVCEFTHDTTYGFYEDLINQVAAENVSMLYNCVGNYCGTLKDESLETIRDCLVTNVFPATFLARAFIYKFKASETEKKAIVSIGCHSSELEKVEDTTFNSAKRGIQMFNEGENCYYESKGQYLFTIMPVGIVTKKNGKKQDFLTCTPKELVTDSLGSLGQIDVTFGCKRFIAYGHISELIRNWFGNTMASKWKNWTLDLAAKHPY